MLGGIYFMWPWFVDVVGSRMFVVGESNGGRAFSLSGVGGTVTGTFLSMKDFTARSIVAAMLDHIDIDSKVGIRRVRGRIRITLVTRRCCDITGTCVLCHRGRLRSHRIESGLGFLLSCYSTSGPTANDGCSTGTGIRGGGVTALVKRLPGSGFVHLGHHLLASHLGSVCKGRLSSHCLRLLGRRFVCGGSRAGLTGCYTDVAVCP